MVNGHLLTDHPAWLQDYCTRARRKLRAARANSKHKKGDPPIRLNAFQERVAHVLGIVAGGLENAPIKWELTQWEYQGERSAIAFVWFDDLGTSTNLAKLVLLCHDAGILLTIAGLEPHVVRLLFHDAVTQSGRVVDLVRWYAGFLPAEHPVRAPK